MNEEDLELLITLDDPGEDDLKEDSFSHSQGGIGYRPGQPLASRRRSDQRIEVTVDKDDS